MLVTMIVTPLLALGLAAAPPPGCPTDRPTIAVHVIGLKNRLGTVRVRLFGGSPATYFDKKRALARIEEGVPRAGAVTVCVALPRPGTYAIDVRHDFNMNGKTDRQDGGGISGNPHVGLFDVIFQRRPDPRTVQIAAGPGRTDVSVVVKYLQGGSFRSIDGRD